MYYKKLQTAVSSLIGHKKKKTKKKQDSLTFINTGDIANGYIFARHPVRKYITVIA